MTRSRLLVVVAALAACQTPGAAGGPDAVAAPALGAGGSLGAGDVIEVRVFGETELSGPFRISPAGAIDYFFCGQVRLAGRTATDAAEQLTRCLASGYLKKPQVTVFQREYNSKKVFVFGEVQKPGTFAYEDGMSVVQAVTLAGGFAKLAAKNSVSVTRLVDGTAQKFPVPVEDIAHGRANNVLLLPGDIVFVPESFF